MIIFYLQSTRPPISKITSPNLCHSPPLKWQILHTFPFLGNCDTKCHARVTFEIHSDEEQKFIMQSSYIIFEYKTYSFLKWT